MACHIGIVPYLNMRPYQLTPLPAGCDRVQLSPRRMVEAFKRGALTAAAIPVGGLCEIGEGYSFLSAFGISASGPVGSVLLFSRCPFEALGADSTLSLSADSATSNRLLYLLLGYEQGFEHLPSLAPPGAEPDAELLIGDAALHRLHHNPGFYVIDLAGLWWQRHGLPFVFARWVIRKGSPAALQRRLSDWLHSIADNRNLWLPRIVREAQGRLPAKAVSDYLHRINYAIGSAEEQGQRLFQEEIKRHGRPVLFPPGAQPVKPPVAAIRKTA